MTCKNQRSAFTVLYIQKHEVFTLFHHIKNQFSKPKKFIAIFSTLFYTLFKTKRECKDMNVSKERERSAITIYKFHSSKLFARINSHILFENISPKRILHALQIFSLRKISAYTTCHSRNNCFILTASHLAYNSKR